MPKGLKLERVTGVVALSYLVLIPVAGYVGFRKIKDLDEDVQELWDHTTSSDDPARKPIFNLRTKLFR